MRISKAIDAFKALNGVFVVYKPAEFSIFQIRNALVGNLCRDLNQLECRPAVPLIRINGSLASETESLTVSQETNYADHPMVVGARYQKEDIRCAWANNMSKNVSGVLVFGVNKCNRDIERIRNNNLARVFHVQGEFGIGTNTFYKDGKICQKATFHHIKRHHLEKLLRGIQSNHQKAMFDHVGIDVQSQEAYEIASQGMVRPAKDSNVLIYGMKCIDFQLPKFTLEITCINENEEHLRTLIHDIGIMLKSVATCMQIRCAQYGYFTTEYALLRKHWTLENILSNIAVCSRLIQQKGGYIPTSPNLLTTESVSPMIENNDLQEDEI